MTALVQRSKVHCYALLLCCSFYQIHRIYSPFLLAPTHAEACLVTGYVCLQKFQQVQLREPTPAEQASRSLSFSTGDQT